MHCAVNLRFARKANETIRKSKVFDTECYNWPAAPSTRGQCGGITRASLTVRPGCDKLAQKQDKISVKRNLGGRHAAGRGQQIPDRVGCGNANGRIAPPLLASGRVVRRIAGSGWRTEEDRGDGRGVAGVSRF